MVWQTVPAVVIPAPPAMGGMERSCRFADQSRQRPRQRSDSGAAARESWIGIAAFKNTLGARRKARNDLSFQRPAANGWSKIGDPEMSEMKSRPATPPMNVSGDRGPRVASISDPVTAAGECAFCVMMSPGLPASSNPNDLGVVASVVAKHVVQCRPALRRTPEIPG